VTGASTYIPDYGDVISNLTKDSANLSITKVDAALDKIIERRSYIGAKLSRIDSAIDKLSAYTANVKGALSSLENTDYAAESAALAKAQILREAGIAAITSAKTSAKDVLALLKISSKPS
jgi:flagellin